MLSVSLLSGKGDEVRVGRGGGGEMIWRGVEGEV